jgi:hypothetical protein
MLFPLIKSKATNIYVALAAYSLCSIFGLPGFSFIAMLGAGVGFYFFQPSLTYQKWFARFVPIKVPFYIATACILFLFGTNLFGLSALLAKTLTVLAPFTYEVFSSLFTLVLGIGVRLFKKQTSDEKLLTHALIQGDEDNIIRMINRISDPAALVALSSKILGRGQKSVFAGIVARLQSLNALNQLLVAVIRSNDAELFANMIVDDTIKAGAHLNNNEALREACIVGNEAVVTTLLNIPLVVENITCHHNEAVRLAQENDHWNIVEQLLGIPTVADYSMPASAKLEFTPRTALQNIARHEPQSHAIEESNTVSWFQRAFQGVTAQFNNLVGNIGGMPPTQGHHLPEGADIDDENQELGALATANEGSMRSPNARQQTAVDDMRALYGPELERRGRDQVFQEIKDYIEAEYALHPATILGVGLPLDPGFLLYFMNNDYYYLDETHSAYRYLRNPNPWQGFLSLAGQYREKSETDKDNMAYMWLAATDLTQEIPEGHTRASLIHEFIAAMAEQCRAHNFDDTTWVRRTRIIRDPFEPDVQRTETVYNLESFNDFQGDRETCGGGVNLRSTQFYMVFLNKRPETRPISSDIIYKRFQQLMINESPLEISLYHKLQAMNAEKLDKIKKTLINVFVVNLGDRSDCTEEEKGLLAEMAFTPEQIRDFIKNCEAYFTAGRIQQKRGNKDKIVYDRHRLYSFEELIRLLAANPFEGFYNDIMRNIDYLLLTKKPADKPETTTSNVTVLPQTSNSKGTMPQADEEPTAKPKKTARRRR